MRYPTLESLNRIGLCPVCLDAPPYTLNGGESQSIELGVPHYAGPAPVSQLPAFTESEVDTMLSEVLG